jgi:putative ABC transport system permease protein
VKAFGYKSNEDVIGTNVMQNHRVIGVVSDFHEQSLHRAVAPSFYSPGVGYVKYIVLNVKGSAVHEVVPTIVREWQQTFPDLPCEYFFMDDFFNQQYKQERQLGALLPTFSALAVFIACLGLFGFTYFMAQQRRREMSIRKVLGASIVYLMKLMTSEFMIILFVAAVVSIPLILWLGNLWLTQYAYRISVSGTHILLPLVLLLVSALITISAQLVKTSTINPAEALRHE